MKITAGILLLFFVGLCIAVFGILWLPEPYGEIIGYGVGLYSVIFLFFPRIKKGSKK